MPLLLGAEHEVVARRAPGGLLGDLDVAACRAWRRGPSPWRSPAARRPSARCSRGSPSSLPGPAACANARRTGNCVCAAPSSAAVPAAPFRKLRRLIPCLRNLASGRLVVIVCDVLSVSLVRRPSAALAVGSQNKKAAALRRSCVRFPRTAALLGRPVVGPCRAPRKPVSTDLLFKLRASFVQCEIPEAISVA